MTVSPRSLALLSATAASIVASVDCAGPPRDPFVLLEASGAANNTQGSRRRYRSHALLTSRAPADVADSAFALLRMLACSLTSDALVSLGRLVVSGSLACRRAVLGVEGA